MLTFAKFGGKCEYIDDAHSIGAHSRIKRSILYFYDFIERWVCFDWKNYRYYFNRVFNLVISTKIKNLLITNILICNFNYFV